MEKLQVILRAFFNVSTTTELYLPSSEGTPIPHSPHSILPTINVNLPDKPQRDHSILSVFDHFDIPRIFLYTAGNT